VIIEGEAVRSCIRPVESVGASEITTLEGLGTPENPHPIQKAWIDTQAVQCGYCMNGQIMTAKALLDRNPNPTDAEIREGLADVLCRCGTYYRVIQAVKRASAITRAAAAPIKEVIEV
jgi:nicotinate dehydrogenase subunit A